MELLNDPLLIDENTSAISAEGVIQEDVGLIMETKEFIIMLPIGHEVPCYDVVHLASETEKEGYISISINRRISGVREKITEVGRYHISTHRITGPENAQIAVTLCASGRNLYLHASDLETKVLLSITRQ